MESESPNDLRGTRRMLRALTGPWRQARVARVAAEWPPIPRRSGTCRATDVPPWSPEGPSDEWERRSLHRFTQDRR